MGKFKPPCEAPLGTKWCHRCWGFLPLSAFATLPPSKGGKLMSACKACDAARRAELRVCHRIVREAAERILALS
jgi:hypothetical protein